VKPLWGVADIIKVDLSLIAKENRSAVLAELAPYAGKLLAEKVETKADLDEAVALGCHYVQGYFFCRPEMIRGRGLTGAEVVHLQFVRELNKPQLDYAVLEQIIKQDTSLTFKLLKYLNSAGVGLRNKVSSIQKALVLMGEQPLRKWGWLVFFTSINSKRPPELLLASLVRAHFCEAVARKLNLSELQLDAFLVGLLSSIDVALGMPMAQILDQTGVSDVVRQVLLGDAAAPKDATKILTLSVACERGAWSTVSKTSSGLRLTQGDIATIYYGALAWANQALAAAAA
jgi:EAL and modified HD-GYP domain-containing signal transduction protein